MDLVVAGQDGKLAEAQELGIRDEDWFDSL